MVSRRLRMFCTAATAACASQWKVMRLPRHCSPQVMAASVSEYSSRNGMLMRLRTRATRSRLPDQVPWIHCVPQ